MAQFFAELKGAKGVASRLGSKQSGMTVSCKSYAGEVNVHMWHDKANASDWATVTLGEHGGGRSMILYHGPCDGWTKRFAVAGDKLGELVWDVEHSREITA